jgi:SAM-dependent methyltransferase
MSVVEATPLVSTRQDFVISGLDTSGRGIEIAPYFNPIVDKGSYDVWYVDCIDNAEIQRKAKENPGAVGKYVPTIDSVWVPGRPLKNCVNKQRFQFAVASHVFEHVPNPIGWIMEILDCLHVGGSIALLIPNRRFTMDFYRRETTFADIIGWYVDKPSIPTPGQIVDFLAQSFQDIGEVDFNEEMLSFDKAKRLYSDTDAINFAKMTKEKNHYLDVHCTVWTPESFVEVFERVAKLGIINTQVEGPFTGFPGSIPGEFLVYLRKTGES